jgi:hypothetical protein
MWVFTRVSRMTPHADGGGADARQFVHTNADLIAHHIEGVPWAERHSQDVPFPKEVLSDHESKRSDETPPQRYLARLARVAAISKLRTESAPRPCRPNSKGKSYDDPPSGGPFLTYCRRSASTSSSPDYLAIGIEAQ